MLQLAEVNVSVEGAHVTTLVSQPMLSVTVLSGCEVSTAMNEALVPVSLTASDAGLRYIPPPPPPVNVNTGPVPLPYSVVDTVTAPLVASLTYGAMTWICVAVTHV